MQKIINRTTLTIPHTFVAGASFQTNLQVGFIADEVIVRQITYGACNTDVSMSVIQTDLIQFGDGILCHVIPNTRPFVGPPQYVNTPIAFTSSPMSHFIINKSKINAGQATFNIFNSVDEWVTNTDADGLLFLTLEFIQYEK